MTTLFLASVPPYPPTSGTPMRSWQIINALAERGPVFVVSFGDREAGHYAMPIAAEWIHFDAKDLPGPEGMIAKLARLFGSRQFPIEGLRARAKINRRLAELVSRIKPDVIVLSHWKTAMPSALRNFEPIVLDMHNVESLLASNYSHMTSRPLAPFILWRWRKRERGLVKRAARTWVCGENDIAELKRLDPALPTPFVWPNGIDVGRYLSCRQPDAPHPTGLEPNESTVIYVGHYSHEPNSAAAEELIDEIFPRIVARIPSARLLLVGASASPRMLSAAERDPRIVVTGAVEDVRPYLSIADVSVVPLRAGGGTRVKILECFAAGLPVVSTAKGAEGLIASAGAEIQIAETADDIAQKAVELLTDPLLRRRQVERADALVNAVYSWEVLAKRLDDALPRTLTAR